ncbi:MAG: hypothetical protein WA364_09190 [Candidatus Nitrosopolaris sp.]
MTKKTPRADIGNADHASIVQLLILEITFEEAALDVAFEEAALASSKCKLVQDTKSVSIIMYTDTADKEQLAVNQFGDCNDVLKHFSHAKLELCDSRRFSFDLQSFTISL